MTLATTPTGKFSHCDDALKVYRARQILTILRQHNLIADSSGIDLVWISIAESTLKPLSFVYRHIQHKRTHYYHFNAHKYYVNKAKNAKNKTPSLYHVFALIHLQHCRNLDSDETRPFLSTLEMVNFCEYAAEFILKSYLIRDYSLLMTMAEFCIDVAKVPQHIDGMLAVLHRATAVDLETRHSLIYPCILRLEGSRHELECETVTKPRRSDSVGTKLLRKSIEQATSFARKSSKIVTTALNPANAAKEDVRRRSTRIGPNMQK